MTSKIPSESTSSASPVAPLLFGRVLLVEDDPAHAMLERRAFQRLVGEIIHVGTVAEARTQLANPDAAGGGIDLIITDLNLPDTGREGPLPVLRAAAPQIPIVMLTSSTQLADAVAAMKLGAQDFIVKSFDAGFREGLELALTRVAELARVQRERNRAEREMQILRSAVENSDGGVALMDSSGVFSFSNRSLGRLIGADPAPRSLGELCARAVTRKDERVLERIEDKVRALPVSGSWSTELTLTGARETVVELSFSRLPEPAQSLVAVWARDVSELRQRENFQRELLSTTTHDLKGPLGTILLSAELLRSLIHDNPKATEVALRVGSSAQGALTLINEFLSARRIEEGSFILRPVPHEIGSLLAEVRDEFSTMAQARGISLSIEPSEPLTVSVDKLALQRVLGNLVSNALKFTPRGGAVVLSARRRPEGYGITVRDTGSGMAPHEVTSLFEKFSRLQKHQEIAGTGLGLFVVRSIVTAHGGRVEITSAPQKGTTFELVMPLPPPVNAQGELFVL